MGIVPLCRAGEKKPLGERDAKDGKIKEAVRRHGRGRLISEYSCKERWDN